MSKARSFFERLTGSIPADEFDNDMQESPFITKTSGTNAETTTPPVTLTANESIIQEEEEAQLTVDMHQTDDSIIIEAMVAGVRPEDLDVSITQDMVTINGKRSRTATVNEDNYYYRELYWGGFSRSILLPQEVDSEEAEATMKHGLLNIKLPKLDKTKVQKLKIKNG